MLMSLALTHTSPCVSGLCKGQTACPGQTASAVAPLHSRHLSQDVRAHRHTDTESGMERDCNPGMIWVGVAYTVDMWHLLSVTASAPLTPGSSSCCSLEPVTEPFLPLRCVGSKLDFLCLNTSVILPDMDGAAAAGDRDAFLCHC